MEISQHLKDLVRTYRAASETPGELALNPENIGPCPRCWDQVLEGERRFFCQNKTCTFALWKDNCFFKDKKKVLTREIAAALLQEGGILMKNPFIRPRRKRPMMPGSSLRIPAASTSTLGWNSHPVMPGKKTTHQQNPRKDGKIMNIKERIKALLGIEVSTDNLLELWENPEKYVSTPEDADKLGDLFLLVEMMAELEVDSDEQY